MISKSTNDRSLIISHKDSVNSDLGDWIPYVVILTAWTVDRATAEFWKQLLGMLLDKGSVYIACIGSYSERLHDEIDEYLFNPDDTDDEVDHLNIVTTYHKNDTIEEAVDYCVYGTEIKDKNQNCILAVLDSDSKEDKVMKEYLLKA